MADTGKPLFRVTASGWSVPGGIRLSKTYLLLAPDAEDAMSQATLCAEEDRIGQPRFDLVERIGTLDRPRPKKGARRA